MDTNKNFWQDIEKILNLAIEEDIADGDVTSQTIIPENMTCKAVFQARQIGVMAGAEVVEHFYGMIDKGVKLKRLVPEGHTFPAGAQLAEIEGNAVSILSGERTALNILQRMCGVATVTNSYVKAIEGTKAKIFDTRKTVPGWRALDKLAVYLGGGVNHRKGLYDMVLIKDNHIALAGRENAIANAGWAVRKARENTKLKIEVEVDTLEQLKEVLNEEPDFVLLDNMDPDTLHEAVKLTAEICNTNNFKHPLLEASGGITLGTVRRVAESGVDRISIGALTHSCIALDIGLDIDI
ncbi:MAG: carboxylating nicotinate-nucleotide diphosphorylase [Planctomycetota bacterium]|jgi:nicotinate-nucleotide pyrophosphorylase (carboxylating)